MTYARSAEGRSFNVMPSYDIMQHSHTQLNINIKQHQSLRGNTVWNRWVSWMNNQGYVCISAPHWGYFTFTGSPEITIALQCGINYDACYSNRICCHCDVPFKVTKPCGTVLPFSHLRPWLSYTAGGHLVALIQHQFYFPFHRFCGLI